MSDLQRDFEIIQEDKDYLNARGFQWETVMVNNQMWLIVHGFPVPEGYNTRVVDAAVMIPSDYEICGLDMVYIKPALHRTNGVRIGATDYNETIRGELYQRWSRHRTSQNPWRAGLDNIGTHLDLVEEWLLRELQKEIA
ncbi:hypothetical protein DP73_11405 [Desulfosporosinus sp. HMP52]|uniref:E2/UBC family protein n=1 Tax=Desulfosporosinus sp. HMP52 TaxID=1487923 RepID=UPI00051FD4EB|nr:E2/UBC family protein [Desulfosporosinus sp. HMP52]KGK89157.1 hypothetical protein DP73_11405 [Desulfosporosinus sp. HMP52]